MLTADNDARIWLNGREVLTPINNGLWNVAQNYTFQGDLMVLAVEIINGDGPTGLAGSFSDGSVTNQDSGWKCLAWSPPHDWNQVGFDDSSWPTAFEYVNVNSNGIPSNAKWIASSDYYAKKTFCRRDFRISKVI